MNVLYQCPICGGRYFLPPGGTSMKCRLHTDTLLNQMEDWGGPNFAYRDEGEVSLAKTHVLSHGVSTKNITIVPDKPPQPMSEEETLRHYRDMYERVSGEKVDKRWGPVRLKQEIEAMEYQHGKELEDAEKAAEEEAERQELETTATET